MVLIDLEKAYNKIPKDFIWYVLDKRSAPRDYIEIAKDMYKSVTNVRTTYGEIRWIFSYHRSTSEVSFKLQLQVDKDELIAHIQEEVLWCMLFADESRDMCAKFERWHEPLKSKALK